MRIAEFSVNRRVTIMMMTVLIIILGGLSLSRLGLELLPDMDFPIITILTTYQGASPEDIEETITRPIEQAIATVKDIKTYSSQSTESFSLVMVEFNWGINLDFAAQDLRDAVEQITGYLPRDASKPLVFKFDLGQMPVLSYGVTGQMSGYDLRKVLDDEISTRLKQLTGVAAVNVMGGEEVEKQIIVDKNRLEFYGISLSEIIMAVGASNVNMAAGYISSRKNEYLLRTVAQYEDLDEIRNTPIRLTQTGQVVYIKDVARVVEGFKEKRYMIRTNVQPTAYLWISKESGANTLTVSNRIKDEVENIHTDYGDQIVFHEIMDLGLPIKNVTTGAASNLIVGGILAILIMFLFLRNWRPTLAISLAIPISVIATFVALYLAKFSLNLMTIGGLALGVGMLVDNSIVVIENIYRHLEMGKSRIEAAKIGATEVGMAITASTLTTVAVFFPMVFSEGMTGILVRGLALTVAFSLFASLFVALTIVPVIASFIFKMNTTTESPVLKSKQLFEKFKKHYLNILNYLLRHRVATLTIVAILFFTSFLLLIFIGTEFMPSQDTPFLIMNLKMPIGTTLDETDNVVRQIEQVYLDTEGVKNVVSIIGPMEEGAMDPTNPQDVNEAQIFGRLLEQQHRRLSFEEIRELIRARLPHIEGGDYHFFSTAEMMGGTSTPIEIKIFGRDLDQLTTIAHNIENRITGVQHVTDVTNTMREGKPEAHIVIDKQKASHYGLTTNQIASTINTATLGSFAGVFRRAGEEIDIRVRMDEEYRRTEADILQLAITTPFGYNIPLHQIATIEYSEGPVKIDRENQTRKVTVSADITGTRNVGGVVTSIRNEIQDIIDDLPAGYFVVFGGTYQDMQEAFKTLGLALALAIILVYLVMASQFESLRQPFVVMFTIPLAAIGVMYTLFLTGITLSVASFIGGIILAGIVVNNGIVLIDHTNQLRRGGMEEHQAILQAGSDRIRPVLITAITTMMGMLPMALSTQEGSEIKVPMALTVIGGLITATFFTLLIIPVIYSVMEKIKFKDVPKDIIK
ncbi:MAG: efflux RND transporter permease subunit [Candidatus Cloacimonetes bacterium]|nr:efflux RND transporter permease subunit [Candidatus Cloacimonadota bacterium]